MKNFKNIFFMASIFAFVSCNPKYYIPNSHNVPLISGKDQKNFTFIGNGNQVEFQGAFGLSDNIAVSANGTMFIPSELDNGNGGSGNFAEFGLGYYKSIGSNLVFETYGVMGVGSFENHLPTTTEINPLTNGVIAANVLRYGAQPSIGYKSDKFSAALSTRLLNLRYSKIIGNLIFQEINQQSYLKENTSNLLLEPALTLRGGFDNYKLQLQFGFSLNLSNVNFRQDHSFLTIGLNFNFK